MSGILNNTSPYLTFLIVCVIFNLPKRNIRYLVENILVTFSIIHCVAVITRPLNQTEFVR